MTELLDPPNICVQNSGMAGRGKAVNITSVHCSGSKQVEKETVVMENKLSLSLSSI